MRVRLRFAKLGKVRFTSHRDVVRLWERALRRAVLPVAYSGGFRPRPKLSFGLALSTGHESVAEYLDVELAGPVAVEVDDLPARLSPELPVGIDVLAAAPVEPGHPSLQEQVQSCTWRIEVIDLDADRAERLVQDTLAAEELVLTRCRKGRDVTDDLRPSVRALAVVGPSRAGTELEAELAVHPRSVRPVELLAALAPALTEGRVVRTAQWIWNDGARDEPLVAEGLDGALCVPLADASATRRDHPDVRARTGGDEGHTASREPLCTASSTRGSPGSPP
ncbi:MAG: TIGR03936 family radical SAM-associated protein [Actinomycetota bacterium]|nr:TIGR03936 family radical SAM-associated protein [Actinomycetota bacterium]